MDFTHPTLRRVCPTTCRESQRHVATSHSSCLLQGKIGLGRKETKTDETAFSKPKSSGRQQQDFLPKKVTGTHTSHSECERIKFANVAREESQPVFDGLTAPSSLILHRKCPQSRAEESAPADRLYEGVYSDRIRDSPVTPKTLSSTVSPDTETRRRRFGFVHETKTDTALQSGSWRASEEKNIQALAGTSSKLWKQSPAQTRTPPQNHRYGAKPQTETAQTDVKSSISQSHCAAEDYNCQSGDIDQELEALQREHRLNRLKTCLVARHARPAAVESITFSQPDTLQQQNRLDYKQHPWQNESCKEVQLSGTALKQTGIWTLSDHRGVPTKLTDKCDVSRPPSVARCPRYTNSFGCAAEGVFDLPSQAQHRAYQRPEETAITAPPQRQQPNYSPADRAFITEEAEDPYYVTMYYPGSVYVGEYRETDQTNPSKHT